MIQVTSTRNQYEHFSQQLPFSNFRMHHVLRSLSCIKQVFRSVLVQLATEASSLKKAHARAHRAPPLLDRVNGQDPTLCNQDQLLTLLPGSDSVAACAPSATEALQEDAAPSGRAELAAEVASSVAEVTSSVAEVASSVADAAREESASVTSPEDDADREMAVKPAGEDRDNSFDENFCL